MLSPVFKFRTGLKGADDAKRTLAWQFLEALTWENYRESMLHNVKESELQNVLNWRNMAFNSQLGCLKIDKLLHVNLQKNQYSANTGLFKSNF